METKNLRNGSSGDRGRWRPLLALLAVSLLILGILVPFMASAAPESVSPDPAVPASGDALYLNITTNGTCMAMVTITNSTGHVVWTDVISVVGNMTRIGPFHLDEGSYAVNATFWYVSDGVPTQHGSSLAIGPHVEGEEKYSPLYVILVGISVVFFVLTILASLTYAAGRLLPKEAAPVVAEATAQGDENERIAAIAVLVKTRRG